MKVLGKSLAQFRSNQAATERRPKAATTTWHRRIRRPALSILITAVALLSTLIIPGQASASPEWTWRTWMHFDPSEQSRWAQSYIAGDGEAGFAIDEGIPYANKWTGYTYASYGDSGLRRDFVIDSGRTQDACHAEVYVRAIQRDFPITIEIWDEYGNKVASQTGVADNKGNYDPIETPFFQQIGRTKFTARVTANVWDHIPTHIRFSLVAVYCKVWNT